MSVLVAGHLCVDLLPALGHSARIAPGALTTVGPLTVTLGGSVANTGRTLVALGVPVQASASIGDDALGSLVRELLATENLGTAQISTVPGAATSYSIVIEPPGGDRAFWHHPGANDHYRGDALDFAGVDVLHLGYPPLLAALASDGGGAIRTLFDEARAGGLSTSLDLAVVDPGSRAGAVDWGAYLREVLPATDIFSPSIDDLTSALGTDLDPMEAAGLAIEWGAGVVAVSAGRDGLHVRTANGTRLRDGGTALARLADRWAERETTVIPEPVERIVTTNGAGDASTAGLLAGLLSGADLDEAARTAVRCAAGVVAGFPIRDAPIAAHP